MPVCQIWCILQPHGGCVSKHAFRLDGPTFQRKVSDGKFYSVDQCEPKIPNKKKECYGTNNLSQRINLPANYTLTSFHTAAGFYRCWHTNGTENLSALSACQLKIFLMLSTFPFIEVLPSLLIFFNGNLLMQGYNMQVVMCL